MSKQPNHPVKEAEIIIGGVIHSLNEDPCESVLDELSDAANNLTAWMTEAGFDEAGNPPHELQEREALLECAAALKKFRSFYCDDLAKNNPGFIGKLVVDDFQAMNEAYIAVGKSLGNLDRVRKQKPAPEYHWFIVAGESGPAIKFHTETSEQATEMYHDYIGHKSEIESIWDCGTKEPRCI